MVNLFWSNTLQFMPLHSNSQKLDPLFIFLERNPLSIINMIVHLLKSYSQSHLSTEIPTIVFSFANLEATISELLEFF